MMKKWIAGFMVLLSMTMILSACYLYKSDKNKKNDSEKNGSEYSESVSSAEKITISVFRSVYDAGDAAVENTIHTENELNRCLEKLGATVRVELYDFTPDVYQQAVEQALHEETVDLFYTDNSFGGIDYFSLCNALPENDKETVIGFMRTGGIEKEGVILSGSPDVQADLSGVKSLEDTEKVLTKLKESGKKVPLLLGGSLFNELYLDLYEPLLAGNTLLSVDTAAKRIIDPFGTEEYRRYCHTAAVFREKGLISEAESSGTVPLSERFSESTGLIAERGHSCAEIMPETALEEKAVLAAPRVTCTSYYGAGYIISPSADETKRRCCIEWLKLLSREKELRSIYGYPDTEAGAENDPADEKLSPAAGFVFDYRELKSVYIDVMRVVREYGPALETGCYPPDMTDAVIEEYRAELEKAGYLKLLGAAQEQYKVWLKK